MQQIRSRLVGGEILEVPIGTRYGYVQFIGTHAEHGDAILVNPVLLERQARFPAKFFANGYVAFYPAAVSVARKLVEVVAQSSPPKMPKRFRRARATSQEGKVESWVIEGGWRNITRQELSEEERSIPITGAWGHQALSERISKGWTPQKDVS